ncbi:hypothetical protein LUZ62_032447 [Rhynchospora pubera]|uniref:Phosphatidylinositol-3,4,5-trisphosphate 3-phosphatase n=1 Tax=Rhynchospora pubera TaxID=906938 RepID=A0AAV8HWS0_9POAL|nr:hypothetical protein LUZ62_032447 [Rhynchospora pubera]
MEKQEVELQSPSSQSTSPEITKSDAGTENQFVDPSIQGKPAPSMFSSWTKSFKMLQPTSQQGPQAETTTQSAFTRISSGLGLRFSATPGDSSEKSEASGSGIIGSLTKGIVDTSMSAVKAVQVKARHMVSQNKIRFQEDGFDLDMTYITENIIAMGFPAGDLSSGLFGYIEGFYRNHMEEVIRFFESRHKGKYKVYNLCSERLYDASLLEGKVASFPFDDHNCPPLGLIKAFCESASLWLKADPQNVVVVHCKAGMGRTGLMISSLIFYLKLFPTSEECIAFFNKKRCIDGKGLVLPSQIRYVEYFEHILMNLQGEVPAGRRCMLRGFRLHNCPNWIRPSITVSNHNGVLFSTKKHTSTKDLNPAEFWFKSPKKGIVVFGLPGEPGLAEVIGDFKVHFQDRQGDFYFWLNTTLAENRKMLNPEDLDGFDKRKLPSPGFQLEVVLLDYDGSEPLKPTLANIKKYLTPTEKAASRETKPAPQKTDKSISDQDKDKVVSDSDGERNGSSKNKEVKNMNLPDEAHQSTISQAMQGVSLKDPETDVKENNGSGNSTSANDFKAIAADTSVFSFGDDEDFEIE